TTRERWYGYLAEYRRRRAGEAAAAVHPAAPVKSTPKQREPREEWRNSAGDLYDPQVAIRSVEELLRLEKLYKEVGQPFNPAVVEGSPAALQLLGPFPAPLRLMVPAFALASASAEWEWC